MDADEALTIDELASRSGLSVRNIRSHISRGLLPEPQLQGRTAYYNTRHLDRLQMITALQHEGLNLTVIARLINDTGTLSGPEATRFYHSMLSAWMAEEAKDMTDTELAATLGQTIDSHTRERLAVAGFIETGSHSTELRVPNPPLFQALAAAVQAGVNINDVINVQLAMIDHIDAIARLFVDVFTTTLFRRHPSPAHDTEDLQAMSSLIDNLRPPASAAVLANFHEAMLHSMRTAVENRIPPADPDDHQPP